MSDRLYRRAARLTVARQILGYYGVPQPNATVITDLRVVFNVTKDLEKTPNAATISIYNLSEATRAEFQIKPLLVILEAGYDGNLQQIFKGDVRWVRSVLSGVDWITTIECGDGSRALQFARISQSYKSGVSRKNILGHLANSMGVKLPKNVTDASDMTSQFAAGVTVDGPSADQMDKLLAPLQRSWSIQDGELQVLSDAETLPGQAYVISQAGGMIGTPELGSPSKPGEQPTLTVQNLLYPDLRPGRKIQLDSRSLQGLFKMRKVTHDGDTHSEAWTTSIEATPI